MGWFQEMAERGRQLQEEQERRDKERKMAFKKSLFSKVLLLGAIFCSLLFIFAVGGRLSIFSGCIALVQAVLFILAWLNGMQLFKKEKENLNIFITIIAFALFILVVILSPGMMGLVKSIGN